MKAKKKLAILLTFIFIFSLTACGTKDSNTSGKKDTATTTATDKKQDEKQAATTEKVDYTGKAVTNIAKGETLNIRKHPEEDAKIKGRLKKGNMATVLKKGEEWSKIQSGEVKGYVANQYLVFDQDIEEYTKKNMKLKAKVLPETLRVRKEANDSSDILTLADQDDKLTVKGTQGEWTKVKTGEGKGYVLTEYVEISYDFGVARSMKSILAEKRAKEAERKARIAREARQAKAAREASGSSSKSGSSSGGNSSSGGSTSIASYALQFVGNPYRWGGASLTSGADCSGFTMAVYSHFGYSLPHSSTAQRGSGRGISSSEMRAGDLICYNTHNGVGHVGIYIGGGQVVHASSPKSGIKVSSWNYRSVHSIRRIAN